MAQPLAARLDTAALPTDSLCRQFCIPNVDNAFHPAGVHTALINKSSNNFGRLPGLLHPIAFAINDYSAIASRARRTVMFGFPENK
jgi:hypothetical protein